MAAGIARPDDRDQLWIAALVYILVTRLRASSLHGTFKKAGFGMGALPASLAEAVAAADLVHLRRQRNPDEVISRVEAEALLALDRGQKNSAASWRDFIADAIADHLLSAKPTGAITPEKADWLIAVLAPAGEIETVTAVETLLRTMEAAREVPAALAVFAISQLQGAIIKGEGPAIGARAHFSRVVDAEDTALLYRILIAAGGADGVAVSREEAEALFDLHDATARSANDPAFDALFYRAIAHHALHASGEAVALRQTARPWPNSICWGFSAPRRRARISRSGGCLIPRSSARSF
jgi:hypothetical protein